VADSKWIIVELSELGEQASHVELNSVLLEMLGGEIEYFIPSHYERVGSYISANTLMEGYVFIKDGPETRIRVANLRDFRLFNRILGVSGKAHTIDSRVIGGLRRRLKNSLQKKFQIGTTVRILEGTFASLCGEVIGLEENGRRVLVRIRRLSRDMIVPVPSTVVVEDSEECLI
jgi:transcription antitermination factor NusG